MPDVMPPETEALPLHDWQPTDNQGYSMECANGCGAYWSVYMVDETGQFGVAYEDGPCPATAKR